MRAIFRPIKTEGLEEEEEEEDRIFPYMHVQMLEDFCTILQPCNMWSWYSFSHTEERNFVAQYVFIIEM